MVAEGLIEAFQVQAIASRQLGSPLYGELCERAMADLASGGPVARLLDGWRGNPVADAVSLRLLGAVHRLVLDGVVPQLARHYPSTGGTPQWPQAWDDFVDVIERHGEHLRPRLSEPLQTNEVSRCAALLGGFLAVAQRTALPLRLLEIGSSAGLNLNWDHYRYELGSAAWGDVGSPVVIRAQWHGLPPALPATVSVSARAGCDIAPVDITDPGQLRMLESFIWPEQRERFEQLRAAAGLAQAHRPTLTRSNAAAWLRQQLAAPTPGVATVIFHSIMWWYLSQEEQAEVTELIRAAGARASQNAPLGWLQMELLSSDKADVILRWWPSGAEIVLGSAHPHGREVWWQ